MNDTNPGERLPFSSDVLIFKSTHKTIGHTNWRVIVFERPEVFHYNRGADDTLKKYRGVCSACITPEENREIQNAIAQAALRTVTHGK